MFRKFFQDKRSSFRFSITNKLILWAFILIVVFLITIVFLLTQINSIVSYSNTIVNVHYQIINISDEIIENVIQLMEYKKKYQILSKNEYLNQYKSKYLSFKPKILYFISIPQVEKTLQDLPEKRETDFQQIASSEATPLLSDALLNSCLDTLTAVRQEHRRAIMSDVHTLQEHGTEAARTGLIGLCFSVLVGVTGSIGLAYHINRSAKELKRGIQQIGQDGKFQPVRVLSRDELGELSHVFNDMSDRLKQEDDRRTDFISMLSHEIRTPMTSIKESLSMIRDGTTGEVNENQKRLLEVSSQEVDRLIELLNRLMSASNLSARDMQLDLNPLDIAPVVQAAVERIQPLAEKKNISLQIAANQLYTPVLADREHIQQVVINVLGNAVKFSAENSCVHIGSLPWKNKKFTVVRIQDEGPGIPESEAAYIFDKYYRGASVKKGIDGTGLGLHISKKIVQAHGGDMWVEHVSQGGSAFFFTLPRAF